MNTSLPCTLDISDSGKIEPCNAGLFISPAQGTHYGRVIDSYELIMVRTGTLTLREESTLFTLEAGETLILFPGRFHEGAAPYKPNSSFYWLHFHLDLALNAEPVTKISQHARLPEPLRLVELFSRFLDDQENHRLEPSYSATLVRLMLLEIALQTSPRFLPETHPTRLASQAQALITRNFRQPLSTSLIARQLNCNPDYLGRIYRDTFGCNPTEAIHGARMRHAKSLLLLTTMNVNEIAVACGYEDADYFRKIFRRHFDMQPRSFRILYTKRHLNSA
jgi:AraC-like DNA-binding protein